VIAVDSDAAALKLLERALADKGLAGLFELRLGDFNALAAAGDVVLFSWRTALHGLWRDAAMNG